MIMGTHQISDDSTVGHRKNGRPSLPIENNLHFLVAKTVEPTDWQKISISTDHKGEKA